MHIKIKLFSRRFVRTIFVIFFSLTLELVCVSCNSYSSVAAPTIAWSDWVAGLRKEAVEQKKVIKPALFDSIFSSLRPDPNLLQISRVQKKTKVSFAQYLAVRNNQVGVSRGCAAYFNHQELLGKISEAYKVDACFIVALWGMETAYGKIKGSYPTVRALATLAYGTSRGNFFRNELLYALHILDMGVIAYKDFNGSWDGGMGQIQFMPSSWHNFAQDYDKTGKKDIWNSYGDAFASMANYLKMHGWQYHAPYLVEVSLPDNFDQSLTGMRITKPVHQWLKMGVNVNEEWRSRVHFSPNEMASIKVLRNGPTLMVFNNFKVVLRWNHLYYFAAALGYLAYDICEKLPGDGGEDAAGK